MSGIIRLGWIAVLLFAGTVQATDIQALVKDCQACHGPDGVSAGPDIPNIAGMSALYLTESLIAYKDAVRPCPKTEYPKGDKPATDMCKETQALSEAQMEAIGEHFSQKPHVAAKQDFDAGKAQRGAKVHELLCEKCHADGGRDPDDDAGVLAGQWMSYLQTNMEDYRSGARPMIDKMAVKVEKLSDEDVEALVHFYASQK